MKIGRQDQRSSAIATSNAETIIVRGHDLAGELVGSIRFTEHFWLLLTGALPAPAQRQVLDATLVAIAEHGLVPSVQAARMTLAAAPEALQGAVAAGILGCGSVVLGSSEAAGRLFAEIQARAAAGAALREAALAVLREYRAAKRAIPGYGHPLHKGADPRALRLFAVAAAAGLPAGMRKLPYWSSSWYRKWSAGPWRSMFPGPFRPCCWTPDIRCWRSRGYRCWRAPPGWSRTCWKSRRAQSAS